ncbi:MAG: hypothetical protein ABR596_01450, partial [Halarsenatibacteraceae bacterium]
DDCNPDDLKCPDKNTQLNNTQFKEHMSTESTTTTEKEIKPKKNILKDSQGRAIIKASRDESNPYFSYPVQFLEFWEEYPTKESKKKAYNCWEKLVFKEKIRPEDILESAINFKNICRDTGQEKRYIKHPSTFLGPGQDWLDYLDGPEDDNSKYGQAAKTQKTRVEAGQGSTSRIRDLDEKTAQEIKDRYEKAKIEKESS